MDHSKCVIGIGHKEKRPGIWMETHFCITHNTRLPETPAPAEWVKKMNFAESLNKQKQEM